MKNDEGSTVRSIQERETKNRASIAEHDRDTDVQRSIQVSSLEKLVDCNLTNDDGSVINIRKPNKVTAKKYFSDQDSIASKTGSGYSTGTNASEKKQRKGIQSKVCPVCSKVFSPNGFSMHVRRCKKYDGWTCDWCHVDIFSIAPKAPFEGPNGPRTLCPDCAKKYKLQKKPTLKVVEINTKDVGDSLAPTRKQKKTKVGRPQRRVKYVQRLTPESSDTQKPILKNNKENKNTKTKKCRKRKSAGKIKMSHFSEEEEVLMLMSALDHSQRFLQKGPGSWMLPDFCLRSNQSIVPHWNHMLNRSGTEHIVTSMKPFNLARMVMQACFAEGNYSGNLDTVETQKSDERAKGVALISAGWDCIFPDWQMETPSYQPRQKWRAPNTKISFHECLSLDEAWSRHRCDLREGIQTRHRCDLREGIQKREMDDDISQPENIIEETTKSKRGKIVPKNISAILGRRAELTAKGDPRPFPKCSWCGPRKTSELANSNKRIDHDETIYPSCPPCQLLFGEGWRMVKSSRKGADGGTTNSADYTFTNVSLHKSLRSVKTFITETTQRVARAMNQNDELDDENGARVSDASGMEEEVAETCSGSESSLVSVHDVVTNVVTNVVTDVVTNVVTDVVTDVPSDVSILNARNYPSLMPLPTIFELLEEEKGLWGVLNIQGRKVHPLHLIYGSSMDIAFQIIKELAYGKLLNVVQFETPFFREKKELNALPPEGGPPPTRFIGVTRMMEYHQKNGTFRATGKFGVEFPNFHRDDGKCTVLNTNKSNQEDISCICPSVASSGGNAVLVRSDVSNEITAGQLYCFIFKILFGKHAAHELRIKMWDLDFAENTLLSFGAKKRCK